MDGTSEGVEFARISNGEEDELVRDGDDGRYGEIIVVKYVNRHFGRIWRRWKFTDFAART